MHLRRVFAFKLQVLSYLFYLEEHESDSCVSEMCIITKGSYDQKAQDK